MADENGQGHEGAVEQDAPASEQVSDQADGASGEQPQEDQAAGEGQ